MAGLQRYLELESKMMALDDEADAVRDAMDSIYFGLTDEERAKLIVQHDDRPSR